MGTEPKSHRKLTRKKRQKAWKKLRKIGRRFSWVFAIVKCI